MQRIEYGTRKIVELLNRGGRRIDSSRFRIEGRFVSLTKAQRDVLLAALAASSGR